MKVLHASHSILEKLEQTQGQTQVAISHPAASVASAMQAIQSAGTSIVSTQAGVDHFYVDIQYIVSTCSGSKHDSITCPARCWLGRVLLLKLSKRFEIILFCLFIRFLLKTDVFLGIVNAIWTNAIRLQIVVKAPWMQKLYRVTYVNSMKNLLLASVSPCRDHFPSRSSLGSHFGCKYDFYLTDNLSQDKLP